MRGATVCRMHGGSAPQVRAKAAVRRLAAAARADAERLIAHEAVGRLADPWETLGRLAVEAEELKAALAARVNALGDAIRYSAAGAGTEQLRAEVALYERAMDRSARFADLLLRHNWEEKRVQLEQARADLVVHAVRGGLDAVPELLPEQRTRFLDVFLRGLREGRRPPAEVVVGELG